MEFAAAVTVKTTPERAFDYFADHHHVAEVLEGVSRWDPIGEQTGGIGARYRVLAGSLSRSNAGRFAKDLLVNTLEIAALWRARGPLDEEQRQTLGDMLNTTARTLFSAGHPDYLAAVEAQHALGLPLPMHAHLAPPLARVLGVPAAARLLRPLGRG